MRQAALFPVKRVKSAVRGYDIGNLASAKIIVSDPGKFGGEPAGLVIWARAALRRLNAEQREAVHQ